ncbi:MAG: phosphopantetheine-binding protein, partial [Sulfurimonadaceae bacterium]
HMTVTVEEIRSIIEEADTMADMDTLVNDMPLTEQDVDSLDMANILLLLEEKFEIKIPDEDMNQVQSIDAIVSYLSEK